MKHLKRFALFLLHLAATLSVQYCLLCILLADGAEGSGPYFRFLLLAAGICLVDFAAGCFLLKGHDMRRLPYMALQLWDLLLVSPMIVLAVLALVSGSEGTGYGIAVLAMDLFLIVERSTSYVLFDPERARGKKQRKKPRSVSRRRRRSK